MIFFRYLIIPFIFFQNIDKSNYSETIHESKSDIGPIDGWGKFLNQITLLI